MRRKFAIGNWKMHGTHASLNEIRALVEACPAPACDMALCLPATLIADAVRLTHNTNLQIGAQNCHSQLSGAFTGEISAPMLADAGASLVIIGHSERRNAYGENASEIRNKVAAAINAGLVVILCVGESQQTRQSGQALGFVGEQLCQSLPHRLEASHLVIAYEPIWAIGTGDTATNADIATMHGHIRTVLTDHLGHHAAGMIRILYGGSVKPENAAIIGDTQDVDGWLVGGASLKARDFSAIVAAAEA